MEWRNRRPGRLADLAGIPLLACALLFSTFASFPTIAGYAYLALLSASHGHYALLFTVAAGAILRAMLVEAVLLFKAAPEAGEPVRG